MSESNAIATINSMEGFQRLAQFSTSAAAKELAGFNMRFDRVKVPSGGGLTFMLQEPDANGNTDFREINAVILTHHPMQVYRRQCPSGMQQHGRQFRCWLTRRKLREMLSQSVRHCGEQQQGLQAQAQDLYSKGR